MSTAFSKRMQGVGTRLLTKFGGVYPQAATVTAWGTAPSALLVISRLEAA